MKIVVTGGRNYKDTNMVMDVLEKLSPSYIFVGDCPTGVDKMVSDWADEHKVSHKIFLANWDLYGKRAGPLRNKKMLEESEAAIVIAFPGGRGTADCVKQAVGMNRIVLKVAP